MLFTAFVSSELSDVCMSEFIEDNSTLIVPTIPIMIIPKIIAVLISDFI